jgi:hypothetical protein
VVNLQELGSFELIWGYIDKQGTEYWED